jgi:hypothetical protein
MAAKNARAIIAAARRELKETNSADPLGNLWNDLELLEWANEGQDQIAGQIVDLTEDFFGYFFDIDALKDVAIYDLPSRFITMRAVEYTVNGSRDPVLESRALPLAPPLLTPNQDPTISAQFAYALFGDQIHIDPVPQQSVTSAFRCWFNGKAPELTFGKAVAGGTQTITLQSSDSADFSGAAAEPTDHYYDQVVIVITAGAGAGQRRRISNYVGLTQVATVETPWATIPDNTSLYATETMIPEPVWRMVQLFTAIAAKGKYGQNTANLVTRYNGLEDQIITLERRTSSERGIQPFDPWDGLYG